MSYSDDIFRIFPEDSTRPADKLFVGRAALDQAMHAFGAIALDKRQPDSMRRAAKRLVRGRIERAVKIEWEAI